MKIEITQGGSFKCLIEILDDNSIKVLGAINGWGDSVIDEVTVETIED